MTLWPWRAPMAVIGVLATAAGYSSRRVGDVAFAVRTASPFYGDRPGHQEWSASALKAVLMVACGPCTAAHTPTASRR